MRWYQEKFLSGIENHGSRCYSTIYDEQFKHSKQFLSFSKFGINAIEHHEKNSPLWAEFVPRLGNWQEGSPDTHIREDYLVKHHQWVSHCISSHCFPPVCVCLCKRFMRGTLDMVFMQVINFKNVLIFPFFI